MLNILLPLNKALEFTTCPIVLYKSQMLALQELTSSTVFENQQKVSLWT